jgi:hypothetical protein
MGFVEQLRRRHDELACDGFGATRGWGSACGALSPTTYSFQEILLLRIAEYLQHVLFRKINPSMHSSFVCTSASLITMI